MATDGELLERYAATGDETAFGQLVERHGPMVRAVCERLAGADADDAAQAVFLLLERKAGRLSGWRDVALWLHNTCRFVARSARRERTRRLAREKEAAAMQQARTDSGSSPRDRAELREHLDAAVAALPERFREAVLLCHLEGASQEEAARRLSLPPGTVASRVSRGLERLRARLSGRGLALSTAALTGLLAEGATGALQTFNAQSMLASVMAASKLSAAGAAGIPATILAKGALHTMFWSKVKFAAAAVAAVTVMGSAVPLTVAAVQGAEGTKGKVEKPLAGEPVPPAPVPAPGIGGGVVVFASEESSSSGGKTSAKELERAVARADVVALIKVEKIADPEKKKDAAGAAPANAPVRIMRAGGTNKRVQAAVVELLRGGNQAQKLNFLVEVRGEGKSARAVFREKQEFGDPATGVRSSFTRSKAVPFTLAEGKKSLVFLKLEGEKKDDAGKVIECTYRLLPPLVDGAPEKTVAAVRAALKKLLEWDKDPKLTAEQAAKIDALVTKLGDNDYAAREKATKDLIAMGAIVRGKIRAALKSSDAETKARAEQVLKAIRPGKNSATTTTSTTPNGVTIIRGGGGGRIQMKVEMGAGQ